MSGSPTPANPGIPDGSRSGFDLLAPWYAGLERWVYGRALDRCRRASIEALPHEGRVLLLGEGDGRFLRDLILRRPGLELTVLDRSRGMLDRARARLRRNHPWCVVRFVHGDAQGEGLPAGPFDLIGTSFFLDCFAPEELDRLLPVLHARLRPGGLWLLNDFERPRGRWRGLQAEAELRLMHLFFRRACGIGARELLDLEARLRSLGLEPLVSRRLSGGLLASHLFINN